MSCAAREAASQRLAQLINSSRRHHNISRLLQSQARRSHHQQIRYSSSSSTQPPPKPIVLEKPDRFRPPSHASRPNARSTTSMYGAGAAYNQQRTKQERQQAGKKRYPNMFPEEGTRMHWFLTNRFVHVVISLGVLLLLAATSMLSTWAKTSPFAHLIPETRMLLSSPFSYFSEMLSVYRMHVDYRDEQIQEYRRQKMLDAQKQRLYRRAHGMEDLDADEVSGINVQGLVDWDDGLTNPERARGGRNIDVISGHVAENMGKRRDESKEEWMARRLREQEDEKSFREELKRKRQEDAARAEEERLIRIGAKRFEDEKPRRKLWLGIW